MTLEQAIAHVEQAIESRGDYHHLGFVDDIASDALGILLVAAKTWMPATSADVSPSAAPFAQGVEKVEPTNRPTPAQRATRNFLLTVGCLSPLVDDLDRLAMDGDFDRATYMFAQAAREAVMRLALYAKGTA